jgi:hypothetical protein
MRKVKDLTNMTFGRWTVISYDKPLTPYGADKHHTWKCRCGCGTTRSVRGSNLTKGISKSCGCVSIEKTISSRLKNLAGQQFGKITIINYAGSRSKKSAWHCQCDCGTCKIIRGADLRNGKISSCGCTTKKRTHGLSNNRKEYAKYLMSNPIRKLRTRISNSVAKSLKRKGTNKSNKSILDYLPYSIHELKCHLERLWEPWMSWSNYGGVSNDPNKSWWIDHIIPHSFFNYTSLSDPEFIKCWSLENIRPLEKIANIKKGAYYER